MKLIPVKCRTHQGIFKTPKKPGRRPVKCNAENPCTRAGGQDETQDKPTLQTTKRDLRTRTVKPAAVTTRKVSNVERVASNIKNRRLAEVTENLKRVGAPEPERTARAALQIKPEPVEAPNISLALAMAAKEKLVGQGWSVIGEAWLSDGKTGADGAVTDLGIGYASITAARGDETMALLWRDGKKISQEYSIWDETETEGTSEPNLKLTFNPDELSDVELVRLIAGQKITWQNSLSGREESAVVAPENFRIDHRFIGSKLDENPGSRVINFLDHHKKSFRAIHVSSLTNVESP